MQNDNAWQILEETKHRVAKDCACRACDSRLERVKAPQYDTCLHHRGGKDCWCGKCVDPGTCDCYSCSHAQEAFAYWRPDAIVEAQKGLDREPDGTLHAEIVWPSVPEEIVETLRELWDMAIGLEPDPRIATYMREEPELSFEDNCVSGRFAPTVRWLKVRMEALLEKAVDEAVENQRIYEQERAHERAHRAGLV